MHHSDQNRNDMAAAILLEKIVRDMYVSKASSEIQPLQWSILRYLRQSPEDRCNVARIKDFLGLTHSPVVRAVNTLVKRGLAEQRTNPSDARSKIVSPTELGLGTLAQDPILKVAERIRRLPEDERERLHKIIRALALDTGNWGSSGDEESSTDRR
jgi:DNA-binding MarR family transcriptional regulator